MPVHRPSQARTQQCQQDGSLPRRACHCHSTIYDFVEWGAALALGQGADEFLGTQGEVWDTHSDMRLAGIGAAAALLTLNRWHNRQLGRISAVAQCVVSSRLALFPRPPVVGESNFIGG